MYLLILSKSRKDFMKVSYRFVLDTLTTSSILLLDLQPPGLRRKASNCRSEPGSERKRSTGVGSG